MCVKLIPIWPRKNSSKDIDRVRVGSIRLDAGGDIYELVERVDHEDREKKIRGHRDIALVKTKEKMIFGEFVDNIELPDINPLWCKRMEFQIAGWGNTKTVRDSCSDEKSISQLIYYYNRILFLY